MEEEEFIAVKCPICGSPAVYNAIEGEVACSYCNKVYRREA